MPERVDFNAGRRLGYGVHTSNGRGTQPFRRSAFPPKNPRAAAIARKDLTLHSFRARGHADALDPEEQHGYDVFKRTGCATCHVGKLLGGQSFEVMNPAYFAERGNVQKSDVWPSVSFSASKHVHRKGFGGQVGPADTVRLGTADVLSSGSHAMVVNQRGNQSSIDVTGKG
jgi:hypothetical protein